jgi:aryl-alcohol dehydrogenase-like predicted oxidoreductase/histidinol phosphatase-like enzyme
MWPSDAAVPLVGIGCMRLSEQSEVDAITVLHAALDAGVTVFDTADVYGWEAGGIGHNDRSRIHVATKGGLTRPNGEWAPDGRARHLAEACHASLKALGVDRIDLYQLHASDPRTSFSTSVRALASLQRDGLIAHIGLCNVNVGQIQEARRIADISAVQVELGVWRDDDLLSGVAAHCVANGIRLIAHRPLGGAQRRRKTETDPVLARVAARHGATPFEIALAWLLSLSPGILPIPGPTRVESVASIVRAHRVELSGEDRASLDERFPSGRLLEQREAVAETSPRTGDARGEVVLIMGLPAAGKSAAAQTFLADGYVRLNRDQQGGSLRGLLSALDDLIQSGRSRLVLDNTYVSRKSRAAVIQAASKRGFGVRCVWLSTSLEDAQVNAVSRMVVNYGRLLGPEEMREAVKADVNAFGPAVQFRYQRDLEPPDASEGFSRIDVLRFERRRDPSFTNRALIVWCDGILTRNRTHDPDEVDVYVERGATLRQYAADGWRVLGIAWQPAATEQSVPSAQIEACYARMQERLGVDMDVLYCPHGGGPPICWCRKPLPGLGVVFIHRYRLDAPQCLYVGNGAQDPGFARRLGFQYRDAAEFFG